MLNQHLLHLLPFSFHCKKVVLSANFSYIPEANTEKNKSVKLNICSQDIPKNYYNQNALECSEEYCS